MQEEPTKVNLIRILITLVAMCMVCSAAFAHPLFPRGSSTNVDTMFLGAHAPDQPHRYSRSEIKAMISDAKTSEDFRQLAYYFDYQSLEFDRKADDQAKELQRLLALPFHARSYPTQVENTRELIKTYRIKAKECSARSNAYREQERLTGN